MSTEISIQEPDIVEISISQNYVTVSPNETAIDVAVNSVDPTVVTISNDQGPQGIQGIQGASVTGPQGPSGVVDVTSPITNGGSSTSATIGILDATTSVKGAVQLTDSTSSTSTTTAATPNSVKTAYDLATGKVALSDWYLNLAQTPDLIISGTINRDANGVVTTANVTWPDTASGTYTTLSNDSTTGAVNSYSVTKGSTTYTQPTMTRNSLGAVTNRPAIVVT
jgi:hypothetical protein